MTDLHSAADLSIFHRRWVRALVKTDGLAAELEKKQTPHPLFFGPLSKSSAVFSKRRHIADGGSGR